ncbi:Formate--tetrahydrofolate ligase [Clarias magur]|uniref:Formate--tetrahydrofolate ligase n=1 Tax=Clarias magur TaxID=1594786 RepID=A0A8J4UM93_CLAMG|nr:Formate--tetrahydrofolate ligase [Clarias magur]
MVMVSPELLAAVKDLAVNGRDREQISLFKHKLSQPDLDYAPALSTRLPDPLSLPHISTQPAACSLKDRPTPAVGKHCLPFPASLYTV